MAGSAPPRGPVTSLLGGQRNSRSGPACHVGTEQGSSSCADAPSSLRGSLAWGSCLSDGDSGRPWGPQGARRWARLPGGAQPSRPPAPPAGRLRLLIYSSPASCPPAEKAGPRHLHWPRVGVSQGQRRFWENGRGSGCARGLRRPFPWSFLSALLFFSGKNQQLLQLTVNQ